MKIGISIFFLVSVLSVSRAAVLKPLPEGWGLIGAGASLYETGLDEKTEYSGRAAGYLASRNSAIDASLRGVLSQSFLADKYRGKRIRYSAHIKYSGVMYQVGIWMWVVDANGRTPTYDFMDDRKRLLKGASGWREAVIVLDVPANAKSIVYGLRLSGPGKAWISGAKIEVVGKDIPVTDPDAAGMEGLPLEPVNLF